MKKFSIVGSMAVVGLTLAACGPAPVAPSVEGEQLQSIAHLTVQELKEQGRKLVVKFGSEVPRDGKFYDYAAGEKSEFLHDLDDPEQYPFCTISIKPGFEAQEGIAVIREGSRTYANLRHDAENAQFGFMCLVKTGPLTIGDMVEQFGTHVQFSLAE